MKNIVFEKVMDEFGLIEDTTNKQRPILKKYLLHELTFLKLIDSSWQVYGVTKEFNSYLNEITSIENNKTGLIKIIVAYLNFEKKINSTIDDKVKEIEDRVNIALLNDPLTDIEVKSVRDDIEFKDEIEKLIEATNIINKGNNIITEENLKDKKLVITDLTKESYDRGISYNLISDESSLYVQKKTNSQGHSKEDSTYITITNATSTEEIELSYNCTKCNNSLKIIYSDLRSSFNINIEYDLAHNLISQGSYPWLGNKEPNHLDRYFIKSIIEKATKTSQNLKEQITLPKESKPLNKTKTTK